jgi:hypothetical protein
MPIDFTARVDRIPNKKCVSCGCDSATKVILDPNKFPNNGEKDTWDVCEECKYFIERLMGQYYKEMAERIIKSGGVINEHTAN